MAQRVQERKINFLSLSSRGYLYKKSDKEAYDKAVSLGHTNIKESKTKDGKLYYHDVYASTEEGYINYLGISDREFTSGGKKVKLKFFSIGIEGSEETDSIQIPLFYNNGSLNKEVKTIISVLPNVDFSEKLKISVSSYKNNEGYETTSIFFNRVYAKDKEDSYVKFALNYKEDVPKPEIEKGVDGSETRNYKKQDTYLYNILIEQIERFKKFKSENTTPLSKNNQGKNNINPTSSSEYKATPSEAFGDNNYNIPLTADDDLPF